MAAEHFLTPRLRVASYEELNAWLLDRCVAYAKAHKHPELGHYLIEPTACTPASGWEKGQVENQVGLVRAARPHGDHLVRALRVHLASARNGLQSRAARSAMVRTTTSVKEKAARRALWICRCAWTTLTRRPQLHRANVSKH
jgi:hypothetical protein